MIELTADRQGVLLRVKVVPGASRTRIIGEWDGRAKIAVAAAPERGKANAAVIAFLAKRLGVRRGDITIVAGTHSTVKTVRIDRTTTTAVQAALGPERS